MAINKRIFKFFFPSLTPAYLIRVGLVALSAYLIFGYLLIPFRIQGTSMEPTYQNGQINFCWKLRYLFSKPRRGDVVVIRLTGQKVTLLKRVIALEHEVIEFHNGKLLINGVEQEEPYLRYPYDWTLPARWVEPDSIYVVGDNRRGPIQNQIFGQTSLKRVLGGPLW